VRGYILKITTIVLILTVTIATCGCNGPVEHIPHVSFSVSASGDGPTVLIVPLPVLQVLVDNLRVSEGKGSFSIVETEHGMGLRVEFSESVKIGATWWPDGPEDFPLMTINLTTMVPIDPNETDWDPYGKGGGIPYREIYVNLTSGSIGSMFISCRMTFDSPVVSKYIGNYNSLGVGWNRLTVEGSQGEVFYD